MLLTIFFLISYLCLYLGILFYPKKENRLNCIKQLIVTFVTTMCLLSVPCLVLKFLNLPMNLLTLGASCLIFSVFIWWKIFRLKSIQKFYFDIYDFLLVTFMTVVFGALVIHIFSVNLNLCYLNSDIANHFDMAMRVVRDQKVGIMFLPAVFNATIINLLSPLLPEIYSYKAFIIGDALLNWIEWLFFYVLVSRFTSKKVFKILLPFICVFFFGGYPLYSYILGGFVYWGVGVLFIGYLIYILDLYVSQEQHKNVLEYMMMLACCAIGTSYTLFLPFTFVALFMVLVLNAKKGGKFFRTANVITFIKIFALPCVAIFYLCIVIWFGNVSGVLESINVDGGIYSNLYTDFIFFVPFIVYNILRNVKEKRISAVQIFFIIFGVCTFVALCICHMGFISRYYYYKLYYPLWLFAWVDMVDAIDDLVKKKDELLVGYAIMVIVWGAISLTNIEDKIIEKVPKIQMEEAETNLFYIYQYNYPYAKSGFVRKDDEKLELYQYTLENFPTYYESGKVVPLLGSKETRVETLWYDAITGQYSQNYYVWILGIEALEERLQAKTDNFIVLKESELYKEEWERFEKYEKIFENEKGIIFSTK